MSEISPLYVTKPFQQHAWLIWGAGGMGRAILDIFMSSPRQEARVAGFIDDTKNARDSVNGLPVFKLPPTDELFSVCLGIGFPAYKLAVFQKGFAFNVVWGGVAHQQSSVSPSAVVSGTSVLNINSVIEPGVRIGDFVFVHCNSMVGHDSVVGRFSTIYANVSIGGNCRVGEGVMIGSGATILPGVRIGNWAQVGAGATVVDNVPDNAVVIGPKATVMKVLPMEATCR